MAKLKDAVCQAVQSRDAEKIGKLVDFFRESQGMNYQQTFEIVHKWTSISEAEWNQLLIDSEEFD